MSAKKKSQAILFTPYLEKGEDLIWVGMPEKNAFLSLASKTRLFNFWLLYFFPLLLTALIIISVSRLQSDARSSGQVAISGICALLAWIAGFFVFGFVRVGRSYYAITTKRLFILRRHLWNNLDSALLILLPEFSLEKQQDETVTLRFAPLRIDKYRSFDRYARKWRNYDAKVYRAKLESMNQEDSQLVSELLQAAKNDVLDQRAREIGLMK